MDIAQAKKGMPLDALWIYEFFKVVCSLLLGVCVTMCCAGGGGSRFYTSVPAPTKL